MTDIDAERDLGRDSSLRIGKDPGSDRLLGSLSLQKRADDDELPDPDPEDQPERVSVPEIAIQFNPCLETLNICPEVAIAAVEGFLEDDKYIDVAEPRYRCSDGIGTLGVWLTSRRNSIDDEARERGLQRVDLLEGNEAFAIHVTRAYIRRRTLQVWDDFPKRLKSNGVPSNSGPIHLTGINVILEAPDKIITKLDGYDEGPWPDVNFTTTITETLDANSSVLTCETNSDTDTSTNWKHVLTTLVIALPWHLYLWIDNQLTDRNDPKGAGCALARLMPSEFLTDGGGKISIFYQDARVTIGGFTAAGFAAPEAREPEVRIIGQRLLTVRSREKTTVSAEFRAETIDMQDPTFTWSADGSVFSRNNVSTVIRFDVDGVESDSAASRTVSVSARDTDDLRANESIDVQIFSALQGTHEDGSPIDAICMAKPWSPQCQPD